MAKTMDDYADMYARMLIARATATKLRRELKEADEEAKELNDILVAKMGKQVIGKIAGMEMFMVKATYRETYTKASVMEVCPQYEAELRTEHHGFRITPLPGTAKAIKFELKEK